MRNRSPAPSEGEKTYKFFFGILTFLQVPVPLLQYCNAAFQRFAWVQLCLLEYKGNHFLFTV